MVPSPNTGKIPQDNPITFPLCDMVMNRTGQIPTSLRVLTGTQFGSFCLGNGLSLVGTWMQRIACGWLIWDWTQSAFWLGVLAAGDLLPVMLIGPFAGVAADRWDRLRQNIRAQAVSALLALLMALLFAIGRLGLLEVIALTTLQGTLSAAIQPARLAMVRQIVGRADLGAAVALNSVTVNLARLIGPALAGMMIVRLDIIWVFAVNAAVTALYVLILGRLSLASPQKLSAPQPFLREMAEGFRHVVATPALWLILLVMLLGGIIVRSMLELMPAIAVRTYPGNAMGLALLTGSAACGAIVSGLTIRPRSAVRLLYDVMVLWGLGAGAAILMTWATIPGLAVAAAALLGAATTRGLISTQTFVQITTPPDLHGRILSLHGLIARGSPALGALVIGFFADRIGIAAATLIAAAMLTFCFLLFAPLIRGAASTVEETD
ncbi:MFS transporter [Paracoccus ferrooxidans]|nr:MFS transporter [Paracoccus ferrooxidans]